MELSQLANINCHLGKMWQVCVYKQQRTLYKSQAYDYISDYFITNY